jgi:hypothetical protein
LAFGEEQSGAGDGIDQIVFDDNIRCVETDPADLFAFLQVLCVLQ